MDNVIGKYIKDEEGNIISPITSFNTVYDYRGYDLDGLLNDTWNHATSGTTQYFNGTEVSINDLTSNGTWRGYVQNGSNDHKYLGWYGNTIVEVFNQSDANMCMQRLTKMNTGECKIRTRTNNQFSYEDSIYPIGTSIILPCFSVKLIETTCTVADTDYQVKFTNNGGYQFINDNNFGFSSTAITLPYDGAVSVTMSGMFSPHKGYLGMKLYLNGTYVYDYYSGARNVNYGCEERANMLLTVTAGDKLQNSSRSLLTIMYIQRYKYYIV